jgi:hypothetical protein
MVPLMLIVPPGKWHEPTAKAALDPPAHGFRPSCWNTSSSDSTADASPLASRELREHLDRCRRSKGALFSALSVYDTLEAFLAPRFVTTLAVIVLAAAALVAML